MNIHDAAKPFLMMALFAMPAAASPQDELAVRMSVPAFGFAAEIEVRDLPRETAEAAIRAALTEIYELDALLDAESSKPGSVGFLNQAAGQGAQLIDPRVADVLRRSLRFCSWSDGAFGPLANELHRLWSNEDDIPDPGALRTAVIRADCERLTVSELSEDASAELIDGSQIELGGIAIGYAVDRAFEILREHQVENAWVEIGHVWRGTGLGPEGKGWLAVLPPVPNADSEAPLDQLWLENQALVTSPGHYGQGKAGMLIDQRTGVPATGVVAIVAVTEFATDAAGLGESLVILGLREGQMRLGPITPRPSLYWLLGDGQGRPLESAYRWSELRRIKRR